MKKFKKILSVVSAAVLCALPMVNGVAANAASSGEQLDTYMVFCDVEKNSGVMYSDLTLDYWNTDAPEAIVGDFGGKITTMSLKRQDGSISYLASYKADGVIVAAGNLFKVKFITRSGTFDNERATAFNSAHTYLGDNVVSKDIVLIGDVNGDTHVTLSDAVLIKQYLANPKDFPLTKKSLRAADVNYDGVVNDDDVLLIQQYDLRTINHF